MPIARLADGTELHFPEGTEPDVIDKAVYSHLHGGAEPWSGQNYLDIAQGAGKEFIGMAQGITRLGARAIGAEPPQPLFSEQELAPANTGEKMGGFAGQAAEFAALPEGRIAAAGRGLTGVMTRAAARVLGGGAVQSARQGEVNANSLGAGVVNAAGGMVGDTMGSLAKPMMDSAYRAIIKLLKPQNPVEQEMAWKLAERVVRERIAPAGSSYESAGATAAAGAEKATKIRSNIEAGIANEGFNPHPVMSDAIKAMPADRPTYRGGPLPPMAFEQGRPQMRSADKAYNDVTTVVNATSRDMSPAERALLDENANPTQLRIPVGAAQEEKRRLDALLTDMYSRGAENAPIGARWTQRSADSWRHHIGEQFPSLKITNANEHELIMITKMLRDAGKAYKNAGLSSQAEGAALGAAAAGRPSIPSMVLARLGVGSPQAMTLSSAGWQVLSKLMRSGPMASRWLAIAAQAGVPEDSVELPSGLPRAPEE